MFKLDNYVALVSLAQRKDMVHTLYLLFCSLALLTKSIIP